MSSSDPWKGITKQVLSLLTFKRTQGWGRSSQVFWKLIPNLWCTVTESESCFCMFGSDPGDSEET